MQIELLQKYVRQPLVVNQVQFSIPVSNLVANGMEVNMETPGSIDHDGSLLDYCRLHNITIHKMVSVSDAGMERLFSRKRRIPGTE